METQEHNPYAAPAATLEPPSPEAVAGHSLVPQVFGILSIVFSGFFLLMMLFFLGTAFVAHRPPKAASAQVERPETKRPPSPRDAMVGPAICIGLGVGLGNIVLFVLGIGQVRYRRWAARGTQVWSLGVMSLLVGGVVWGMVVSPRDTVPLLPAIIMLLAYPVLLLIFFSRARAIASMQRR